MCGRASGVLGTSHVSKFCLSSADVPEQLLSMVEHTIQKATEGKTTLYKASALLEFTSNIFLYTHRSTQDRFNISHQHMKLLDQFDDMFGKMMSARLNTNMEQAQNYSDKCVRCVGELGQVCV